jgi:hypothetical protein
MNWANIIIRWITKYNASLYVVTRVVKMQVLWDKAGAD